MTIYTVKRGDTLWRLSRDFGVSVNSIVTVNQLPNPDQLVVGQALIIPTPERIHIVRPGETLWQISRQYGTTIDAIAVANNIQNPALIFPGQRLTIPQPRPTIDVNGYLSVMGAVGRQAATNLSRYLTYLSVFSYHILRDGSLTPLNDTEVIGIARSQRAAPQMTITNFEGRRFSSELANDVLTSVAVQDRLIANIIDIMNTKGFVGLNIDFEYVFPRNREDYNRFLVRVTDRLRPLGYLVSSALAPKVSATQAGLLYEAHDYAFHGRVLDFVVLMTYEWGWAGGPPWAIAPINEVKRVLDFAVTVIPRNKILMGMPTYGRDWRLPFVAGQTIAATISPQEAVSRAFRNGAEIKFNQLYQSPFFNYVADGVTHEVWFEDARSAQAKYDVVKQYNLRGVSYWELSSPFPQNWPVLLDNFSVRKII